MRRWRIGGKMDNRRERDARMELQLCNLHFIEQIRHAESTSQEKQLEERCSGNVRQANHALC